MSRILRCFLHADLRSGHVGLTKTAAKEGVDVTKLAPGEFVVFINGRKDRLKVYTASNVVAYLITAQGQRVDLNTIREIPRAFQATGKIDYDATLKETLEKSLSAKGELPRASVAPHVGLVVAARKKHAATKSA